MIRAAGMLRIVPRDILRHRSASLCAFLREEGVTRKRDGRRTRDGKTAKNRKRQQNKSLALSFSRLRRQLPLGGSLCSCVFFPLCRRENKDKTQGSKLKVAHFPFCGSAAFHHEPSSGRKVSRVSVTKGARGTEKRRKTESLALSFSRLRRQLPLGGSL